MSRNLLTALLKFIPLALLQVYLLNNIDFLGFIDPVIYALFILLFPINGKRWVFLLLSFSLGLIIDMFQDSGGAHAVAMVVAAYIRPSLLTFVFGRAYHYGKGSLLRAGGLKWTIFWGITVIAHHLILFILLFFSFNHIIDILLYTVSNGLASWLVGSMVLLTIRSRKR